ncbi:MAG TPA: N-succinylarginine dihydrolase, partial [Niastella sp.]|nr:N-succinylarginine dihydrolase [Niastella sp.]
MEEIIFIGLPGTTHHYGGLSSDNVASDRNRGSESNPKQAALQATSLARYLHSMGIMVGILPPQLRPHLPVLQENGFTIENAPIDKLEQASSSSFMWAANAATVTPTLDSKDGKLHLTVANLHTNPHRRIEAETTYKVLSQIFHNVPDTVVHEPLSAAQGFLDEGAANHMRLSPRHNAVGLNVFVYGRRQNLAASRAVAEHHKIPEKQALFIEQNAQVIKQGVFHNDVIAVGNENLLLVHEAAYANGMADIEQIKNAYKTLHPQDNLQLIIIKENELSVEEAVHSYFFNSQIVTKPDGKMVVIAPLELKNLYSGKAAGLMERIRASSNNSIDEVQYLDLRQSMRNGGGPACLRLRVPVSASQADALRENTGILVDNKSLAEIETLVGRYYSESLTPEGLRNPELYKNCQ